MRFCQNHWDQLRKVIDDKGLGHLVSKDEKEAVENANAGKPDPLMATHNSIIVRILEVFGPAALFQDDSWCPMCHVVQTIKDCKCGKEHTEEEGHAVVAKWFDGASDAVKKGLETAEAEATGGSASLQ